MTTIQLKYFLEAADTLNFTLAARHMFVSQPTLSRQIAMLEQELKIQLFERSNNVLRLSPAGAFFAERAREILEQIHDSLNQLEDFHSPRDRTLQIGLLEDQQLTPRLQNAIHQMLTADPNIVIEIRRGSFSDLAEQLNQGILDLCQVLLYEDTHGESYESVLLSEETPCLAVRRDMVPDLPASILKSQLHQVLKGIPLIAAARKTYPEQLQPHLPALDSGGLDQANYQQEDYQIYVHSLSTISMYVLDGLAASIVNPNSLLALEPRVALAEIRDLPPIVQGCIWRPENENPLQEVLISLLLHDGMAYPEIFPPCPGKMHR